MEINFHLRNKQVGWSNVISGLFGGFTGSYIFSQTIFNLRAGTKQGSVDESALC